MNEQLDANQYKNIFIESDMEKLKTIDDGKKEVDTLISDFESGKRDKKKTIDLFSVEYLRPTFQEDNEILSLYALEQLFKLFKQDDRGLNAELLEEIFMSGLVINDKEFQDCYLGVIGHYCYPFNLSQIQAGNKEPSKKEKEMNEDQKKELRTIMVNIAEAAKELRSHPLTHDDVLVFTNKLLDFNTISDEAERSKLFGNLYGQDPEHMDTIINEMFNKANDSENGELQKNELITVSPHIRRLPEGQIPSSEILEFATTNKRTMDGSPQQISKKDEKGKIIPLRAFVTSKENEKEEKEKGKFLIPPYTISDTLRAELQLITYHTKLSKEEKDKERNNILDEYRKIIFDSIEDKHKEETQISSPSDLHIRFETLIRRDIEEEVSDSEDNKE